MEQHILRLPTVKAITGLSRSTIYLRMSEGSFPRQVNLGSRAVGWLASEIDHWIEEKLVSRNRGEDVE
jgi:prophage regulatory protein